MAAVKLLLSRDDAHLEVAKGTEEQNREYCTKEETRLAGPFMSGTYKPEAGRQGARSDITALKESIKQGASRTAIAEEHTALVLRYPSGIAALQEALLPKAPVERDIWVHVLWGPTDVGKTHRVLHSPEFADAYIVRPGRDPWGKYNRQTTVVFEEFSPLDWKLTDMNTYLDKWRCDLDARYTNKEAHWTTAFILSNLDPDGWYALEPLLQRQAFLRRIKQITKVTSRDQEVNLRPAPAVSLPLATALPSGAQAGTSAPPSAGTEPAAPAPMAAVLTQVLSSDDDDNPAPLKRLKRTKNMPIVLHDDDDPQA